MINLACCITLLRIFLTPVVISLLFARHWQFATIVFIGAALTDLLDGFVARRLHQQTRLGQLLDPVADKCLLMGTMYTLLMVVQLSAWQMYAVYFLLAKEVILLTVGGWLMYQYRFFIAPSRLSRTASIAEIMIVLFILSSLMSFGHVSTVGLSLLLAGNIVLSAWLLIRYVLIIQNYLTQLK